MRQIYSAMRRYLKWEHEPETEDQNKPCLVVGIEDQIVPSRDGSIWLPGIRVPEMAPATPQAEANRKAWVEVVIARCEVASLNDGCEWESGGYRRDLHPEYYYEYKAAPDRKELNHGCHGVDARNPFPRCYYLCKMGRRICPVMKEVQRCLDEPSILITTYKGTHTHPLPVGATVMASTALSDGTSSSFTQAYLPHHASYLINQSSHPPNIRIRNPADPSKGIIVDLTSNANDPPQSPMAKSLMRDQEQNRAPKIPVIEDLNKANSTTISTSFSSLHCEYDVFLSFRGKDTRVNFTDHLYSALKRVGIRTFRDDDELPRGKSIFTELVNGIRRSMIFIVIFSEDYASSKWCLNELAEFIDCQNTNYKNTVGHTLFPIFYHVDPSDVRKQIGTFAKAFARHEEQFHMEMVNKWRGALTKAGNCAGWHVDANRYESEVIDEIVDKVLCEVNPACLNVAKHPIGMRSRVQDIKHLLNLGRRDVRIVGIYGMGGIGKTTLAKAVYNEINDAFDGSSFLFNLKESSKTRNGIAQLQEQLLHDILKTKLKIDNFDRGINIIEERIHGKKVLVILDDVADLENLHKSVKMERLGPGSRIIVTTRDESVLSSLGVDKKYEVKELNYWKSLRLFSWHAFNMASPKEECLELSKEALDYAGGVPLALELLGSFLKVISIVEWKITLEKLRRAPLEKIQNILRISFDALDVDTKNIFLDIACFFVGMDKDKDYIIQILDGCDFFPDSGIKTLTKRSLLTIDGENKFRMHGLIRDMGREIIRKKPEDWQPTLLGERSRLWFHKDVLNVLRNRTGTIKVEGLVLKGCEDVIKTEAFTNMKCLRLLQINDVHLEGSYEHLPKELIWLCWHKCPRESLPQNFHLKSLVVLDMQHSNVKQVWEKHKILDKLKVLNLSNSKRLIKSPNFSQVPKLEILILEDCTGLVEIHESIGGLGNLVLLNLKGCKSLMNLPSNIFNLKSLKTLDLSGCLKVDKLPNQIGNMMALTELLADGIAIEQLPSSFGLLKNLEIALLSGYKERPSKSWVSPLSLLMSPKSCLSLLSSLMSSKSLNPICFLPPSISGLRSLKSLDLSGRNLSENEFPVDFASLSSLEFLDLSRNNFCNLPDCIEHLPKLDRLLLRECTALQSISGLSSSINMLDARDCTSMKRLSISSNHERGLRLHLLNCPKLTEVQGLEDLESTSIHSKGCNNLAYDFRSPFQLMSTMGDDEYRYIFLSGREIPNWFSHKGIGYSISFHAPSISNGQFLRLLVSAVYTFEKVNFIIESIPYLVIKNKTRGNVIIHSAISFYADIDGDSFPHPKKDYFFLCLTQLIRNKYELESGVKFYESVMESGDEIEVSIQSECHVKKCGVHLLVAEPNVM